MDNSLFITAMTMYVVIAMLSLVLAIVSKSISKSYLYIIGIAHALCLLLFLTFKYFTDNTSNAQAYLFLSFFCSGLLMFGLSIRKRGSLIIKIYSLLFMCSILVFVVKPSRVLAFITQTPWPENKIIEYKLDDNLYLIGQSPLLTKDAEAQQYKVIRKLGSFHRTLARDLEFEQEFDSVQVTHLNDSILVINTFDKLNNLQTNSDVVIDFTKLKKRDNANI